MKFLKIFERHTLTVNQNRSEENLMSVSDVQRLKIAEKARVVFDEETDIFMAHLPVCGAEVLATKNGLSLLRSELSNAMLKLENSFVTSQAALTEKIAHLPYVVVGVLAGVVSIVAGIAGLINVFIK